MLIDSHCHLHDREFFSEEEAENCIERARRAGIERIVCIGTDPNDSLAAHDFALKHDEVYWTCGIHPENASRTFELFVDESFIDDQSKLVGVGEVGLDYHYDGYDREAQIKLFEQMLQIANDNNLPVSLHVREAFEDFFPVIANFPRISGVVHSFTDNKRVLKRILNETDFYIGVNGLATYSTLPMPPLERILLETDAPFLAPVPHRGEQNEPAYIADIARWLAVSQGRSLEDIKQVTTQNADNLFFKGNTVVLP